MNQTKSRLTRLLAFLRKFASQAACWYFGGHQWHIRPSQPNILYVTCLLCGKERFMRQVERGL